MWAGTPARMGSTTAGQAAGRRMAGGRTMTRCRRVAMVPLARSSGERVCLK